jgi:hypothetical protein
MHWFFLATLAFVGIAGHCHFHFAFSTSSTWEACSHVLGLSVCLNKEK